MREARVGEVLERGHSLDVGVPVRADGNRPIQSFHLQAAALVGRALAEQVGGLLAQPQLAASARADGVHQSRDDGVVLGAAAEQLLHRTVFQPPRMPFLDSTTWKSWL